MVRLYKYASGITIVVIFIIWPAYKHFTILHKLSVVKVTERRVSIAMLTAKVASLTEDLNTKDNKIDELVKRVNTLEEAADAVEQYSRRPNLRFHGIAENANGEGTDAKIVHIVNDVMKQQPPMKQQPMKQQPPMLVDHLERSHRLGPREEPSTRATRGAID